MGATPSLVAWSAIDACASIPEHGELVTVKADLVAANTGKATAEAALADKTTELGLAELGLAKAALDVAAAEQKVANLEAASAGAGGRLANKMGCCWVRRL